MHKVDTARMEASRRTKNEVRFQGLMGLEAEPLDLLAIEILKDDPSLEKPSNQRLVSQLKKLQKVHGNWARIS